MNSANAYHHTAFHKVESNPTNGIACGVSLARYAMGRHGNLPHSYPPAVDEAGEILGQWGAVPCRGCGKGVGRRFESGGDKRQMACKPGFVLRFP